MSTAEELALDALRKELAMKELEAEFRAAKAAGTVTADDKLALRAARAAFREARNAAGTPTIGEVAVSPDTIEAAAAVGEAGAVDG